MFSLRYEVNVHIMCINFGFIAFRSVIIFTVTSVHGIHVTNRNVVVKRPYACLSLIN